jgi:hypothetical protein
MAALQFAPASLGAVVSFYALIHVPLADQRALFPRIRSWLRPAGLFLAIVGAPPWTGTERYLGADMFWDHAGTGSYLDWLEEAGFVPQWGPVHPGGERPAQPHPGPRRRCNVRANLTPASRSLLSAGPGIAALRDAAARLNAEFRARLGRAPDEQGAPRPSTARVPAVAGSARGGLATTRPASPTRRR